MSHILIRLDGLLLGLVIVAGGGYPSLSRSSPRRGHRRRNRRTNVHCTIASHSLWLVLVHAVALALLAAYTDSQTSAPTGPDWIDWLAVPWFVSSWLGQSRSFGRLRRENRPEVSRICTSPQAPTLPGWGSSPTTDPLAPRSPRWPVGAVRLCDPPIRLSRTDCAGELLAVGRHLYLRRSDGNGGRPGAARGWRVDNGLSYGAAG